MAAVEVTGKAERLLLSWKMVLLGCISLAVFSQSDVAARAYGWVDPVVSPITVTSITPTLVYTSDDTPPKQGSIIAGDAVILRECDAPYLTWHLKGAKKTYNIPVTPGDPPQDRGLGPTSWSAIIVGVPPDMLFQTQGFAHHRCGMFPVESPFFIPSTPEPIPDELIEELGARAECESGAYSKSSGSGTCSNHGGVRRWIPSKESA